MLRDLIKRYYRLITYSFFGIIAAVCIIWSATALSNDKFYSGIYIDDINVSGMNSLLARGLVEQSLAQSSKTADIKLLYEENSWKISTKDISYGFLLDEAIDKAYSIGREGSMFNRLVNIAGLTFDNVRISPQVYYDRNKLRKYLLDIKRQIDTGERNATVSCKNGSITFNKEIMGRTLDIDTNMKLVENHIVDRKFDEIKLIVAERAPEILLEDIKDIHDNLGVFSTKFSLSDVGRSHNIRLAAERLNNTVIMPGQIFSMNNALGPRTTENGYQEAPVIFKNELVKGTGGGVCQVTSTLYASVLRAMLDVIERSHHSRPLGYIQPGQDATIAEGSVDFKFQNNIGYPVCIFTEINGGTIKIGIKGKKTGDEPTVRIKSEIIEEYTPEKEEVEIDNTVPEGIRLIVKKPRMGYKVAVYRERLDTDGKLIDREKISEDIYKAAKAQIKINELSVNVPVEQLTEMVAPDAE